MTIDKSLIQSCVDHINTAIDVDPWAKELVAEMGKEILKAQLTEKDTTSDCISRRGAIYLFKSIADATSIGNKYNEGFVDGLNFAVEHLKTMPSVQPTYTDAEVQKMQDMHQVEIEKAFDLGRKDAKAEVIHCEECKHADHTGKDVLGRIYCLNHGLYWDALAYCSYAERRINETD